MRIRRMIALAMSVVLLAVACAYGSVVVDETTFPDNIFRAYVLSANTSFDKNQDGTLTDEELAAVTNISVFNMGIDSLKGVEYFTALTQLGCEGNQLTTLDVSHNSALLWMHCANNQLTSLDLSHNSALDSLFCGSNPLISLDVSHNTALESLHCEGNTLTTIDVSHNSALTELHCQGNQLTSLDLSHNSALTGLSCGGNPLTSLDVSNNTALEYLDFDDNQISALDLTHNENLIYITCRNNQLTSLDLSHNSALESLHCEGNTLTTIDVSHNSALKELYCEGSFTTLDLSNNPALEALGYWGNMTTLNLSNNPNLTTLECWNNQLITLDVSSQTKLAYLSCGGNQLTSLDLSNNPDLIGLECSNNQLTELDVRNKPNLLSLNCSGNKITALDLSNNPLLISLCCNNNCLAALDLSANLSLDTASETVLQQRQNYLFDLSLSSQTPTIASPDTTGRTDYPYSLNVSTVDSSFDISRVYSLDVTGFSSESVSTSLDVSEGTIYFSVKPQTMSYSYYTGNKSYYMDVTATLAGEADTAPQISTSTLPSAQIGTYYSADITASGSAPITWTADGLPSWLTQSSDANTCTLYGTPTAAGTYSFTVTASNPAGSDTKAYSITVNAPSSWTAITESTFPDETFRNYITNNYDSNSDGYLSDSETAGVTRLNLRGQGIADLTGIETFTALVSLDCNSNDLTSTLDLSANTELVYLDVSNNGLTELDVSGCYALKELLCDSNQLTALDVSQNTALTGLYCRHNKITALDVNNNTLLEIFDCDDNQLTALDITNNTKLDALGCGTNQLTALDITNNTVLTYLACKHNQITALDTTNNELLRHIDCGDNQITSINVSSNTLLDFLDCRKNKLTAIDVTANAANLHHLFCSGNQITELDVTQNINLIGLGCNENLLTTLDLSHNNDLDSLWCEGNQLTTIDVSNLTHLNYFNCAENPITALDVSHNMELEALYCFECQLMALDLSSHDTLQYLNCAGNKLMTLDLNNNATFSELQYHAQSFTLPGDTSTITGWPYVLNLSSALSSADISATDFFNVISSLDVYDSSENAVTYSTDISEGIMYFAARPSRITYSYNTHASVEDPYMYVVITPVFPGSDPAPSPTPSGISGISVTSPAEKSITLNSDGGTFSATLSATGEAYGSIVWTASADQGLTATISGSGSTATLSGTAQPNTSSQDISGTITITAHDDYNTNYSDTLTVIVSGRAQSIDITSPDITTITGIALTPETVNLSADGGSVNVTAQIQGTPSGDISWSISPESYTVSPQTGSSVNITGIVPANTSSDDITHTVKVTAMDSVNIVSADFSVIVSGRRASESDTESKDHHGQESQDIPPDERPYHEKSSGDSWGEAYIMGSYSDFMDMVSRFLDGSESSGKYYSINADLDLSAVSDFQSIGSEANPFRGHFDGNGRTITIPANSRGLFGVVDTDGIAIQNLSVRTAPNLYNGASGSTTPTDYAGGIVQELVSGTITNCTFTGTVTADGEDSSAGGIVGLLSGGTIQNCRVLSGSGVYASHSAGGIAGYVMAGSISGCASDAEVYAEFSGGIAGYTESERQNLNGNSYTAASVEVGNDILNIELLPDMQTVSAGAAITDIQVSSDNAAAWSFRVSGDYALGLTSRDMAVSGTIPANTQAGTYTVRVNALNSNGFTVSAQAYITVTRAVIPESGDVISGDVISEDVRSEDVKSEDIPPDVPDRPDRREKSVDYAFEIPSGVMYRMAMLFGGESVYQFTDDEIISGLWGLDESDSRAIADLSEHVVLHLPVMRPRNSGLYMLRLNLSETGAGKKISLYGITSGTGGVSATTLEELEYVLLDENGNEISEVPANGIVYAALRLTANREHRGVITSPIELEQGTIQPIEPDETLLEKIAETVKISADRIMFITEENISDPKEPTDAMRSELAARQNELLGKFNTLTVDKSGYYVLKVTLSDDLYERVKNVSVNELKVYALYDDGRTSSADVSASFITGLLNTWELLTLSGEKLEFGVKEFLMVGFLNAGTPFSVYLAKLIIMLLLGGCDSGLGIAGFAVVSLGTVFLIIRRKL